MENHHYPKAHRSMVIPKRKMTGKASSGFSLCLEELPPADTLSAYTIWLHGQAGIGKTSLSAMFPQSHLFCAGGQAKALKARYVVLQSWGQFANLVDQFKQSTFKTATIDLVESLYDMCFEHVLNELQIDYPGKTSSGKDDFGKSWFFIRKEFAKVVSKLMSLEDNQGLVMVSNSIYGERTIEEGSTVEDVHPNLSARPLNFIAGAVDIIGFYTLNGKGERELVIRPKPGLMAKCRIDHRFKYTNGKPIEAIPMGNSKEEAYKNFMLAFDNKLSPPVAKKIVGKK
jgi:hypothetical protein